MVGCDCVGCDCAGAGAGGGVWVGRGVAVGAGAGGGGDDADVDDGLVGVECDDDTDDTGVFAAPACSDVCTQCVNSASTWLMRVRSACS